MVRQTMSDPIALRDTHLNHDAALQLAAKLPGADTVAVARRRPSAAVAIHRCLHDDILSLRRPPGAGVNERAIATQFGVSRTPVREALLQLAAEGLIEMIPQVGTFVARISLDQLPEAVLVRQALEETVARLAARRRLPRQIDAMKAAIDRQRQAAAAIDMDRFYAADEDLHGHIAAAAGYPLVWHLVRQAKDQVDRYRHVTLPQTGRLDKVIDQHQEIVAAIATGDAKAAALSMRRHISALMHDLAAIRSLHPDWFTDRTEEAGR